MVDMTAFLTVPIKHNIKIKALDNIGLCGNWDNANDESFLALCIIVNQS